MEELTFITGNPSKAEQLWRHLQIPLKHRSVELQEIQSLDLNEIVRFKTLEAFKIVKSPVLVEDTSLVFHALGKLPGPFIKWFITELGNEGLCKLLKSYKDRTATAEIMYGYYNGKSYRTFSANSLGTISAVPLGTNGFGWDPIFIPRGSTKTWGQMQPDEQAKTSMRRLALQKMKTDLNPHLNKRTSQ